MSNPLISDPVPLPSCPLRPNQPDVIVLGFCDSKLAELQFLKAEISKSCNTSIMDLARWPHANAMEVDSEIQPARWFLTETRVRKTENTEEEKLPAMSKKEVAALSDEEHFDLVTKYAKDFLRELHSQFHGVIALGAGKSETAVCSRIIREALPVGFPKLLIPTQASEGEAKHAAGTDMMIMYSASLMAGNNDNSEKILRNAAAAIVAMAIVERERHGEK